MERSVSSKDSRNNFQKHNSQVIGLDQLSNIKNTSLDTEIQRDRKPVSSRTKKSKIFRPNCLSVDDGFTGHVLESARFIITSIQKKSSQRLNRVESTHVKVPNKQSKDFEVGPSEIKKRRLSFDSSKIWVARIQGQMSNESVEIKDQRDSISSVSKDDVPMIQEPEILRFGEDKIPTLARRLPGLMRSHTIQNFKQSKTTQQTIQQRVITAPAEELIAVAQKFEETHQKAKKVPAAILVLRDIPNFAQLTLLQIEHGKIRQIFHMLQPCVQLQALFLAHNEIHTKDVTYVQQLVNLRKLDLSFNNIQFLPAAHTLMRLKQLEFLLLNNNEIVGWSQVENLSHLKGLRHLTLQGNPCSKLAGYRKYLIEKLPNIYCLDEFVVIDFEQKNVEELYPRKMYGRAKMAELKRFKPYNAGYTSWTSNGPPQSKGIIEVALPQNDESYLNDDSEDSGKKSNQAEMRYCYNADIVTRAFEEEHYALRRKFEWCSPALTITKTVRMFLVRKFIRRRQRMCKLLYVMLRKWRLRWRFDKFKRKLGLQDRTGLKQIGYVRRIQNHWRQYHRNKILKKFVALRIQSNYRMYAAQDAAIQLLLNQRQTKTYNIEEEHSNVITTQNHQLNEGGQSTKSRYSRKLFKRQSTINVRVSSNRQSLKTKSKQNLKLNNDNPISPRYKRNESCLSTTKIGLGDDTFGTIVSVNWPEISPQNTNRAFVPRLLFRFSDIALCDSIGVSEYIKSIEQCNEFVVPKLDLFDLGWIASSRSPLHLLIKASYRMVELLGIKRQRLRRVEQQNSAYEVPSAVQSSKKKSLIASRPIEKLKVEPVQKSPMQKQRSKGKEGVQGKSQKSVKEATMAEESQQFRQLNNFIQGPHTRGVTKDNALLACQFDSVFIVSKVLKTIFTYNRQNPYHRLLVFYEPMLIKLKAIIRIQRWVKFILHKLRQTRLFQQGVLARPVEKFSKNQATQITYITPQVIKIQRMIRNWRFRSRIHQLEKIAEYASKIKSNTLYLEENVYLSLGKIESQSVKGRISSFMEQNFKYQFDEGNMSVTASFMKNTDVTGRYAQTFLPKWFNKKAKSLIPSSEVLKSPRNSIKKIPYYNKKEAQRHLKKFDIQGFIHSQPHPANTPKLPSIKSLSQIVGKRYNGPDLRFVCICFQSDQEAHNRAVLLALRTCNYLRNCNIFVRMYTAEQLVAYVQVLSQVRTLLNFNKVPNELFNVQIKKECEVQMHNGFILRHSEPYMTIIRARPRIRKNCERFIILDGCDPEQAGKRYADLMAKGNRRQSVQLIDKSGTVKPFKLQDFVATVRLPLELNHEEFQLDFQNAANFASQPKQELISTKSKQLEAHSRNRLQVFRTFDKHMESFKTASLHIQSAVQNQIDGQHEHIQIPSGSQTARDGYIPRFVKTLNMPQFLKQSSVPARLARTNSNGSIQLNQRERQKEKLRETMMSQINSVAESENEFATRPKSKKNKLDFFGHPTQVATFGIQTKRHSNNSLEETKLNDVNNEIHIQIVASASNQIKQETNRQNADLASSSSSDYVLSEPKQTQQKEECPPNYLQNNQAPQPLKEHKQKDQAFRIEFNNLQLHVAPQTERIDRPKHKSQLDISKEIVQDEVVPYYLKSFRNATSAARKRFSQNENSLQNVDYALSEQKQYMSSDRLRGLPKTVVSAPLDKQNKAVVTSQLIQRINEHLKSLGSDQEPPIKSRNNVIVKEKISQSKENAEKLTVRAGGLRNLVSSSLQPRQTLQQVVIQASAPKLMTIQKLKTPQERRKHSESHSSLLKNSERPIPLQLLNLPEKKPRLMDLKSSLLSSQFETKQFGTNTQSFQVALSTQALDTEAQSPNESSRKFPKTLIVPHGTKVSKKAKTKVLALKPASAKPHKGFYGASLNDQFISRVNLPELNRQFYSSTFRRMFTKCSIKSESQIRLDYMNEFKYQEALLKNRSTHELQDIHMVDETEQNEGLSDSVQTIDVVESKLRSLTKKKRKFKADFPRPPRSKVTNMHLKVETVDKAPLIAGRKQIDFMTQLSPVQPVFGIQRARITSIGSFSKPMTHEPHKLTSHSSTQQSSYDLKKHRRLVQSCVKSDHNAESEQGITIQIEKTGKIGKLQNKFGTQKQLPTKPESVSTLQPLIEQLKLNQKKDASARF